jgi:hypothetical protein
VYRELVNHLATVPVIAAPNLRKLAKEHGVQEETVYSIYSQEINNRVMKMHSALRSAAVGLLKRYAQGMFYGSFMSCCCRPCGNSYMSSI